MKRRHRHDRGFHPSSINQQYITAMTNVLFQMQREINRLKRHAARVENILSKQIICAHPVIRIPRLTQGTQIREGNAWEHVRENLDDLSAASANARQEHDFPMIEEENEKTTASNDESLASVLSQILYFCHHSAFSANLIFSGKSDQNQGPEDVGMRMTTIDGRKNKYCQLCKHEYASRSAFLLHVRRTHQRRVSEPSHVETPNEVMRSID